MTSPLHALRPQTKVAATVLFVLAVVATPREALWAFALHVAALAAVAAVGRVPARSLRRRLVVGLPFVAFAVLLPFVTRGPRFEVLGVLHPSEEGLWAAWNLVAKGTIGLLASTVLLATTPAPALLAGLDRLRVPRVFVAIAGFMLRYLDVIAADLRRLQVARVSRGHDPRWIWQARAVAATLGALFVRTFERGERIHLAMASRGYTGTVPTSDAPAAPLGEWVAVLALPAAAALVSVAAWGAVG